MTNSLTQPMLASASAEEVRASIEAATACKTSGCAEWREAVLDAGGESKVRPGLRMLIERCQGQPCELAPDPNSMIVRAENDELAERTAAGLGEGSHYAQA